MFAQQLIHRLTTCGVSDCASSTTWVVGIAGSDAPVAA